MAQGDRHRPAPYSLGPQEFVRALASFRLITMSPHARRKLLLPYHPVAPYAYQAMKPETSIRHVLPLRVVFRQPETDSAQTRFFLLIYEGMVSGLGSAGM